MIKNIPKDELINNPNFKNYFLNSKLHNINLSCNLLSGNFYLDSFNYFPITEQDEAFDYLFIRDKKNSSKHFFKKKFHDEFNNQKTLSKEFRNIFVLGSSPADNYYSNLIQFLPRIFFNKENNIKIAIHRNLSNKFRSFINEINIKKEISYTFVYLDDGFYNFKQSLIPQFFETKKSINILKNLIIPDKKSNFDKKIYVTREDSYYRKILNEFDIIKLVRSKGYKVINPRLYSINEQINIFSNAEKIISPHGSNLSNIIFCKPDTKILELSPPFKEQSAINFKNRYREIAKLNKLKFTNIIVDTVEVEKHSELALKYIGKKYLNSSDYYKNLIVKKDDILQHI
tara:strand:- start:2024 stop:3052 length:1029 start_codon:yes stop_codon:yes gene_type:complete